MLSLNKILNCSIQFKNCQFTCNYVVCMSGCINIYRSKIKEKLAFGKLKFENFQMQEWHFRRIHFWMSIKKKISNASYSIFFSFSLYKVFGNAITNFYHLGPSGRNLLETNKSKISQYLLYIILLMKNSLL